MTGLSWEFLTGVQLGVEHIDCSEDDYGINWMIGLNLLIVRVVVTKYQEEDE